MEFHVRFYFTASDEQPVVEFLEDLRRKQPLLHKLVVAAIRKLEQRERHGPPLTELVDGDHGIFELRVGARDIARVFFFFRRGQELILTNGYVKKAQKVASGELARAQTYKQDWEARFP